ncbi:MAG TPA: hypothetical protein VE964_07220, partial [Myxococcales bacterium]|nr:hypothetical protein [Myxococcales bacterium]
GGGALLSVQSEGEQRQGQDVEVVAHARGMDWQTVGFSLEVAGEDGSWREVASTSAPVRDGMARAALPLLLEHGRSRTRVGVARVELPLLLEHESARARVGAVLSAQFEGELRDGAPLALVAHAQDMESQTVGFFLELAGEDGTWREVGTAKAVVRDGVARAGIDLPPVESR